MPVLTPPILLAQIRATLPKTRGARALAFRCPDGWDGPDRIQIDGRPFEVRECRSDLEAREALASVPPGQLVVLARAPEGTFAEDTMARLAKGRLLDFSPRETLLQLTGAQAIDPRLLMHQEVVTLLVRSWRPDAGLVTPITQVIDCGRAFAFLLERPGLAADVPDLTELLVWSLEDGMRTVRNSPAFVRDAFFDWLRERNGGALPLIRQALGENGHRLVSLGLLLGALFPADGPISPEGRDAGIRLERFLGDMKVNAAAARDWSRAAVAVTSREDQGRQKELMRDLDQWLHELKAGDLASQSDFSPLGLDQRLDRLADALTSAARGGSGKSWTGLRTAVRRVEVHALAKLDPPRMERVRMAVRLTRWLQAASGAGEFPDPGGAAARFLNDSAFADWARQRLRHGDGRESLNKAYKSLLSKVDDRRGEINSQFARLLRQWVASGERGEGLIPIEAVIEKVLVPLAKETRVLLLVLDGMSGAVFAELMTDLTRSGWHALQSVRHRVPRPVIAALPSITRVSRAALFRGRLDAADTTGEAVNFREHPLLHSHIQSRNKPRLFLKADLADPGGAGLSSEVMETILRPDSRVAGVVINAIDDQLSTLGQLTPEWTVSRIKWLRELLDAAAAGQRVVVLTSDHGHVPDKEQGKSLQLANAEGDRHRGGFPEPKQGEMAFSGPRLLAATGVSEWTFCQSEDLRYGGRKSGYHGGVADQEVIVPLVVLSSTGEDVGDFQAFDFQHPEWWAMEAEPDGPGPAAALSVPSSSTRKKKPVIADSHPLELWAASGATDTPVPVTVPATAPAAAPAPAWIRALLESAVMAQQRKQAHRTQVSDDRMLRCLSLLESKGGAVPLHALARELDLPQFRLHGFVAQMQRLLNVEGYPVLETDASETLRLNREMLLRQFEIKP